MGRRNESLATMLILVMFAGALVVAALSDSERGGSLSRPVADASRVAAQCDAIDGNPELPDQRLRQAFIDQGGSDPVRLLLEATEVRPGESLAFAPLNESAGEIRYGLAASVEDPATGETLPGAGEGLVLLIGLSAGAGEVGPCVSVDIPNSAPPGPYLAVLEDVDGQDIAPMDVKAAFTVAKEPRHDDDFVPAGIKTIAATGDAPHYSRKDLNEASRRIGRVLRDEPATTWGIYYRNQKGLGVEIPELTVAGFDEIDRVAGVPVRLKISAGPTSGE